jgi:integrase
MTPTAGVSLPHPSTRLTDTAAVADEVLEPAQPSDPEVPVSAVDAFLAKAAERRTQRTRDTTRPAEWNNPDPDALRNLTPDRNPVLRALKRSKAGRSRDNVRGNLRMVCGMLQGLEDHTTLAHEDVLIYPWHQLSVDAAADLRVAIYKRYENQGTRNDKISAVRRVVTECFRRGLVSALQRDLLLDALFTTAPGPSTRRRRLAQEEIDALLHAAENLGSTAAQARNTAIIAVFRTSGMRVGELIHLWLHDWSRADGTLHLRDTKNGHAHLVYLHPDAVPYLERWLAIRGTHPGALFGSLNTKERSRPMGRHAVNYMLMTRAAAAGIDPFGSHDFRRTFATELLRTHDVALVGKLLNQRKPASTLIYDLADEEIQRDAIAQLRLPTVGSAPDQAAVADNRAASEPRAGGDSGQSAA